MHAAPLETDPLKFCISDKGRLERLWVALLYVLIESWESAQMAPGQKYIAQHTMTKNLDDLLRQGRRDGHLDKMRETNREEMRTFMIDEMAKFHALLTPDQRNKAADLMKEKQEKMGKFEDGPEGPYGPGRDHDRRGMKE